jgi:hypothetical protein
MGGEGREWQTFTLSLYVGNSDDTASSKYGVHYWSCSYQSLLSVYTEDMLCV